MNLDLDGIDWQIAHPGPRGTTRSPKIELQVKSTSAPLRRDGMIYHRMSVTHFNELAGTGFQVPRFLAVVTVPRVPQDYAVCTHDHMRLSNAAYWLSLAEQSLAPVGEGSPDTVLSRFRNEIF